MSTQIKKKEKEHKKMQLLAASNAGEDWRPLAHLLNVPLATAYRWISEGETIDGRGGKRFQKVAKSHLDFFVEIMEKNSRMTLAEMGAAFREKFQFGISKTTIARHLDSLCYCLKHESHEAEDKEKRKEFVERILEFQSRNKPILLVDGTSFNIHVTRTQARSIRGRRGTSMAAGSKDASVHVIGCISLEGLIHYDIRRGSFKKDDVREWVRTCCRQAMARHNEPHVIVIGNASYHSSMQEALQEKEFRQHCILRLDSYSPILKHIWSVVKNFVNRELPKKLSRIQNRSNNSSLGEQKVKALETLIEEGLQTITPDTCVECITNIQNTSY